MNNNSISECLAQVVNLTKKNLEILKAVNEAFYTKRNHLAVIVDEETFVIPSFISLESRIEALEHNLENIVDAPLTGEALTYFNGTTQKIELSGYQIAPNHVDIQPVTKFGVENNNIFKDFMTPNPYIKIDIASIPNNIKHVVVRKVSILNENLRTSIDEFVQNGNIDFADLERLLFAYIEGTDYVAYDTMRRLPIRKGVAQGEYEIIDIIDNYQDPNFDEFYELELGSDLVYYINNGTIQRDIKIGDTLVTYNDKVIMEVMDLNTIKHTMLVKILQGAYADLQDKSSGNPSLYKLKYYKESTDTASTKYVNIPLEEDQYVAIFVAPVNDTTNTRAPWGKGIYMNVDNLQMQNPLDPESQISFREYYDAYVNNIGDTLASITSMMDDEQQVSRLSSLKFDLITKYKPEINKDIIDVTQINKHLDNTKSIKTIRKLYDQKNQHKMELDNIQRQIDQVNNMLVALAFDDTSNIRTVYETQLQELEGKRNTVIEAINKDIQEISTNANNSETPIENAKYRIRGFVPITLPDSIPAFVDVIKIDVEYRYKNKSNFTSNAKTFDTYIFSDWNKMDSIYRKRVPYYEDGRYQYKWEDDNGNTNNPSFNQIDIPITQGEIVDIRVRFIYSLGHPFIETRSDWSQVYTQEFPTEYMKNVEILDIIAENNDEIKTKAFENILDRKGILSHIDDAIQDQNIKYFHKAEHISSGFLTEERRVIPLDTKLQNFHSDIENLKSEVFGAASTNLLVSLGDSRNTIQLNQNIINKFHTYSFRNAIENAMVIDIKTGSYSIALSQLTLSLYNNGSYDMRLYSLFPGSTNTSLAVDDTTLFPVENYAELNNEIFMMIDSGIGYQKQTYNQFLYFRKKLMDINGEPNIYKENGIIEDMFSNNDNISNGIPATKLLGNELNILERIDDYNCGLLVGKMDNASIEPLERGRFACLYPYIGNPEALCVPNGETFITLAPGESISIPICFVYWFKEDIQNQASRTTMTKDTVTRMMSFDIRTSLYHDPITYKFTVDASYIDTKSFENKKDTISGVQASKYPRLIPSTPRSVAKNTTELMRANNVTQTQIVRKR